MTATLTNRSEGTAAHKGFNPKTELENRCDRGVAHQRCTAAVTLRRDLLTRDAAHRFSPEQQRRSFGTISLYAVRPLLSSVKIASVVGARPQFIKAAPVSREIRQHHEEILVHTGQHYDENMSDVFFEVLDMPRPDYNLGVGSGSHARQTADMMHGLEDVFEREKPDLVLVYGDTNSTLATLHRPASVDDRGTLEGIVDALIKSGRTVVFPIHPRTRKNLESFGLWEPLRATVKAIEPVDYLDFIALLMGSSKVVTDSGGVQKEAYFFRVPCLTPPDETEGVAAGGEGWNALVGAGTAGILDAIEKFNPSGTK